MSSQTPPYVDGLDAGTPGTPVMIGIVRGGMPHEVVATPNPRNPAPQ
jgi:hypothetical protein